MAFPSPFFKVLEPGQSFHEPSVMGPLSSHLKLIVLEQLSPFQYYH